MENNEVRIVFDSKEKAEAFMSFMSSYGEQVYWDWTDCGGHPYARRLDYDWKQNTIKEVVIE